MDIIDIERALRNFGRLAPEAAEAMYPKLSQELMHLSIGGRNVPLQASSIHYFLQDLRLEQDERLMEEMWRLLDTRGSLRDVNAGTPE